jgi:F-box/WD-40 domain protein 7
MQGHEEIVWAVEVHGHRLFSASADKTIRVWDIDSRRCEHVLEDHTRPVLSLAISGSRLYSGSYDFTIKVRRRSSSAFPAMSWGLGALGPGRSTAAACIQAVSVCWSAPPQQQKQSYSAGNCGTQLRVLFIAVSCWWGWAMCRLLKLVAAAAVATSACAVLTQVWDLNTLSRVKTLTGHTDAVRALASADGRLFSGSYDGTVRVWDENSLQCLEILKGHTGPVRTLVYAGGCMFSGSYDKSVRVWDVHTLECKAVLTGHTGAVRALVASANFGYVFSGSDDTTIKVWDARTHKCVKTLEGHEDNVRVLAVGETCMFSGSWDKTIRVWDLRTLVCIKVLEGHTEAVLALAGAWWGAGGSM